MMAAATASPGPVETTWTSLTWPAGNGICVVGFQAAPWVGAEGSPIERTLAPRMAAVVPRICLRIGVPFIVGVGALGDDPRLARDGGAPHPRRIRTQGAVLRIHSHISVSA